MSEKIIFSNGLLPLKDSNKNTRVFIPSKNINIFPCSRRGQFGIETVDAEGKPFTVKANGDPEARLNTERTNRLRTSINGFTDSFIVNDNFVSGATLTFTLAGYRIEVKEFDPAIIATALGITNGKIYAHLSLHDGIPFGVANYYTEILYRQSTSADNNYIDVEYTDGSTKSDFFMGVSFTSYEAVDTIVVNDATKQLKEANLPLFSKSGDTWKLVEASKLPSIKHGDSEDSIIVSGDATFNTNIKVEDTATIARVEVPYRVDGQPDGDTIITTGGINTPYIYAKALAADGIAVGGELSIVDDLDPDLVHKQTKIGHTKSANGEYTHDGITTTNVAATGNITAHTTLNVIKAEGTTDPAVATIDKAVIDDVEINESLTVGTDKFSVTADAADFTVPVNVNNNVTIDGEKNYIKTPTLDVKTIKNDGTEAVKVDDDLTVTGNTETNTLSAITEIGTPLLNVTGDNNSGQANIDKAIISNLEVTKQADIGYINVGTPTNKTTTAGDIIAQNNISAEGTITADNQVSTPTLVVDTINSDAEDGLTITPDTTINKNLTVIGETALQKLTATEVSVDKITQNSKPVPAIKIEEVNGNWQLQITTDASKK